ncbi:MAG TPA: cupin domain-containing protein [Tissierellia bacterium]|nr:cupin domain-containing protein [Tissierellia bacterium]
MGYPDSILTTRAKVEPGKYCIIPKGGTVVNSVPGFEETDVTILCSPRIGASFSQYVSTFHPGGRTTVPFGREKDIETFIYVIDGQLKIQIEEKKAVLKTGGYAYAPPGAGITMENNLTTETKVLFYKQRYRALEGVEAPEWVVSSLSEVEAFNYDGIPEVTMRNLLPTDMRYDMNFHTLECQPGAGHPFIETHDQEHSMYVLQGSGMYNLDNTWMPVQEEDYIWMGPYSIQGAYGVGRIPMLYIYSKDCNRDVEL